MPPTSNEMNLRRQIDHLQQRLAELEAALHSRNQNAKAQLGPEDKLTRQEAELRATLYSIGDAVIAATKKERVARMNRMAEELTGWREAEAIGQPLDKIFRLINEQTRRQMENPVARVLREEKWIGPGNHTLLASKDGSEVPIASSAAPIFDPQENITGVVLVFRDQTEERLTRRFTETRLSLIEYAANHTLDELLTEALDRVGAFVDSPIGFYHFVEPDQKTLSLQQWSTRTLEKFCQIEGKDLHYDVDQAGVWVDCVYAKQPVIHNDYSLLPHKKGLPDGHAEVVRELVVPVMRDDQVVAILGVGNKPVDYTQQDVDIVSYLADVTWEIVQQKRVEEALRQSEARYRAIAENFPKGMVALYDQDLRYTVVDGQGLKQIGMSGADLEGKRLRDVFPPQIYERDEPALLAALRGETVEVVVPFGDEFFRVVTLPVRDEHGNIINGMIMSQNITALKRTELELKNTLNELRLAIDTAKLGVWRLDIESGNVNWNDNLLEIHGISREEFEKNPDKWQSQVYHLTDKEHTDSRLEEIFEGESAYDVEFQITRPNGEVRYVNASASPIFNEKEKLVEIIGIGIDITDIKKKEAALRTSEKKFRDVVSSIPGGVYQFLLHPDSAVEIPFMSEGAQALFDRPTEELKDTSRLFEDVHPDDVLKLWASIEASAQRMSTWRHEFRIITKAGQTKWLRGVSSPSAMKDGTICWTGVLLDVTERKQAEERLAEANRVLIEAERLTQAGNWIWYVREHRVRWSNGLYRIYGRDSTTGPPSLDEFFDHIHPDDQAALDEAIRRSFETGHYQCEYRIIRYDDGEIRYLSAQGEVTKDENGSAIIHFGVVMDITERRRAEEEKAHLEKQFHQAQKMDSIGRLAGGVAHDFNNMLSVIIGHTELVLAQINPAQPYFADLEEIRKAAERSANLTRQLLAFARKQTVMPQTLNLNDTVEGMLKMLRRLIGEDIDLVWLPKTKVWSVKVDPSQIDQILANLCVNARDAIEGVGRVIIETDNITLDEIYCEKHPEITPGQFVLLAVSDDGCGMDKETLDNIFEPFFTTKDIDQGSGLGLATVYGIVKQNKGFIHVYSEMDHGTTFKVYLPRYVSKTGPLEPERLVTPADSGHETILLVEDEPAILEMGRQMLENFGYQVLTASTPSEAIRLAQEYSGKIHLLLTDVIMPEMNGQELAEILLSLYPDVVCLFMSGYTANVVAHRGVLQENVNFIQKPFRMQNLAAKVREALESKIEN